MTEFLAASKRKHSYLRKAGLLLAGLSPGDAFIGTSFGPQQRLRPWHTAWCRYGHSQNRGLDNAVWESAMHRNARYFNATIPSSRLLHNLGFVLATTTVAFVVGEPSSAATQTPPGNFLDYPIQGDLHFLVVNVEFDDIGFLFVEGGPEARAEQLGCALEQQSYDRVDVRFTFADDYQTNENRFHYLEDPENPGGRQELRREVLENLHQNSSHLTYNEADYDREIFVYQTQAAEEGTSTGEAYRVIRITSDLPNVWIHEAGHSFDFAHANLSPYDDNQTPSGPFPFDVGEVGGYEYGNYWDYMGELADHTKHFNPWFKARADWLKPYDVETVPSGQAQQYTLRRLDLNPRTKTWYIGQPPQDPTALRIPRDEERDYWVFYLGDWGPSDRGAMVSLGYRRNQNASILLDMQLGGRRSTGMGQRGPAAYGDLQRRRGNGVFGRQPTRTTASAAAVHPSDRERRRLHQGPVAQRSDLDGGGLRRGCRSSRQAAGHRHHKPTPGRHVQRGDRLYVYGHSL